MTPKRKEELQALCNAHGAVVSGYPADLTFTVQKVNQEAFQFALMLLVRDWAWEDVDELPLRDVVCHAADRHTWDAPAHDEPPKPY